MIKLKANKQPFQLAQGWHEVTLKQWKLLEKAQTSHQIAEILTGLEVNDDTLFQLLPFLKWFETPFNKDSWKLPTQIEIAGQKYSTSINIRNKEYAQKILLQQLKPTDFLLSIMIYMQPVIDKALFDYERAIELMPLLDDVLLCELYPLAENIYKQLKRIVDTEREEIVAKPTAEQIRAGIAMFDVFGVNNTIDALAGGDVLKYNDILRLDYNTIFVKLKRNKLESTFKNNYSKIMNNKQN